MNLPSNYPWMLRHLSIALNEVPIAMLRAFHLYICTNLVGNTGCEIRGSHIVYSNKDVCACEPQQLSYTHALVNIKPRW